jgi:hypothetical protein
LVKVRFCTPTICARFDIHVFGPTSPSPPDKYDNSLCAPCPCHVFRERRALVCVSPFPTVLLNFRCLFGTYTSLSLTLFFFFCFSLSFSLALSLSSVCLALLQPAYSLRPIHIQTDITLTREAAVRMGEWVDGGWGVLPPSPRRSD